MIALGYLALVALAYAVGPEVPEGCLLEATGQLTTASGDHASFSGLAVSAPLSGAETYRDAGPAHPTQLSLGRAERVSCDKAGGTATVSGRVRVNGARLVHYRIDVRVDRSVRRVDSYRIRLSDGYDSGARVITVGNLLMRAGGATQVHRHPGTAVALAPATVRPTGATVK